MAASEHSATEHERLREAIGEIKSDAKETRAVVQQIKDVLFSKVSDMQSALATLKERVDSHDKILSRTERNVAERVNLIINALLGIGMAYLLWRATGKTP